MRRNVCVCVLLVGILLQPVLASPWQGSAPVSAEASVTPAPHLGYGFMLAHTYHLPYLTSAGFDWYKYFVNWDVVDGNRDRVYNWETVDWLTSDACAHGLNLLLRVGRASDNWTPVRDAEMAGWEAFFGDLAAHIVDRRAACAQPYQVALEIWNEPNLDFQWGYEPVDPVRYTEMVRRAYRAVKAVDPRLHIIAGSLAPTGGWPGGAAMDDVAYLQAMYAAGLKGHFDAISIHNYGFGSEPEDKAAGGGIMNFRRAEDIYATMVAHGDGDKAVWGTEFGWLLQSEACSAYWDSIGFGWQQVTASQQADYLVRAFAYADANWPWMQVMVVSNLDFAVMPWYPSCEPMRWFGVLEPDTSPRPAYTALAQMQKRPRTWAVWGMDTEPAALSWTMLLTETRTVSRTVTVRNTGDFPFRWTARVDAGGLLQDGIAATLPVTVAPAEGDCDSAFTVTVDARGLLTGTHAATLTITADQPDMPDNPRALPIRLYIVDRLYGVYVPVVQRTYHSPSNLIRR